MEEYLRAFGINDRQVRAILYIKARREITNADYQALNKISKPVATRDLTDLLDRRLISKIGTTSKGTKYILARSKGS